MKALIYTGAESLKYDSFPTPKPNHNEVLLKIKASSICGSDMHAYLGHDERRPAPLILGHEASGTIVEGNEKGLTVVVNPLVTCGTCSACTEGQDNLCQKRQIISMPPRQGAFCEYITIPRNNLITVPKKFPLDKAALCEPIACGRYAVNLAQRTYSRNWNNAKTIIFGGGAIGLAAAVNLKERGVSNITIFEPSPLRSQFITTHYEFSVINSVTDHNYDIAFDAYGGKSSRQQACELVRPGGIIIHNGLADNNGGFDARRATLQEITFIGAYTYTKKIFQETAECIFSGKLGELPWQEIRHLSEGAEAFRSLAQGKIAAPKITFVF